MKISPLLFILSVFLFSVCESASGQGTISDYRRADLIEKTFKTKIYNIPRSFHWLKNGQQFWYINPSKDGKEYIIADVVKKNQKKIFDNDKLAKVLSVKALKPIDPKSLPFDDMDFSDDLKNITFKIDSAKYKVNLTNYKCDIIEVEKKDKDKNYYWGNSFDELSNEPVLSPDSTWIGFIKNYNVYIRSKVNEEFQISYDGAAGNFYSSYMYWSPDSKKLMAYKVRPGEKHLIHFVESSPKDQLQPKLHTREYLKPGDELPHKQPQLFLIDQKKHIPVSDELFKSQFYLEEIRWNKESTAFTFEFNERGHQTYKVIEVDTNGLARPLIEEKSNTFIDYSGKKYRYDVTDSKEIVWASERDGWNHLYLYDAVEGKLKNQITKGDWVVRSVVWVDEKQRRIIFSASGLDAGWDPYLLQYCEINFDGSGLRRLTTTSFEHNLTFSQDYKYYIDQYSTINQAPVSKVFQTVDGKELMKVQEADINEVLKTGWRMPEPFSAKGRDGKTDIWGVIVKPSNFDPNKKYPVIELIYAGPQSFFTPKSFTPGYRGVYSLAELGFIVVQMDGMGTSWRSKAFHDVCYKNLKDAGFPDRIAWMKAAAQKFPYMDISLVGIFGGSAGGQNAGGSVLFHPEFYKAAVASCGCHDNRMDKMWWNEQWMGYPVGPHYAECSNVVNAHKLKGNLMLIVGELDDNVDPASTMQFADALIKAKKDFDLVVVPGMGHSGGGEFGERKRRDFFVKHLLGVNPPKWSEVYPDINQ